MSNCLICIWYLKGAYSISLSPCKKMIFCQRIQTLLVLLIIPECHVMILVVKIFVKRSKDMMVSSHVNIYRHSKQSCIQFVGWLGAIVDILVSALHGLIFFTCFTKLAALFCIICNLQVLFLGILQAAYYSSPIWK